MEQCETYDLSVMSSLNDIYKPIDLDMYYEVLDGVPNSEGILYLSIIYFV